MVQTSQFNEAQNFSEHNVSGTCFSHCSLFTGIGGFDLAAQWIGWDNIFQVEIDESCNLVLNKNFPTVTKYNDIKNFNGLKYRNKIDVLTAGVPCQPFSVAGQRKGKGDERYLFDEAIRVVSEIEPKFIIFENVKGFVSENNGETFEEVHALLESIGYETQSYIIPASSIGANHRRERTWVLGWNTNKVGCIWDERKVTEFQNQNTYTQRVCFGQIEPSLDRKLNGISRKLDTNKRIEMLANAIVPQIAYEIFKVIEAVHLQHCH